MGFTLHRRISYIDCVYESCVGGNTDDWLVYYNKMIYYIFLHYIDSITLLPSFSCF